MIFFLIPLALSDNTALLSVIKATLSTVIISIQSIIRRIITNICRNKKNSSQKEEIKEIVKESQSSMK